jgi:hypothetical protein
MASTMLSLYEASSKPQKMALTTQILDQIKLDSRHFLKQMDGVWEEVEDVVALKSISHSFQTNRSMLHSHVGIHKVTQMRLLDESNQLEKKGTVLKHPRAAVGGRDAALTQGRSCTTFLVTGGIWHFEIRQLRTLIFTAQQVHILASLYYHPCITFRYLTTAYNFRFQYPCLSLLPPSLNCFSSTYCIFCRWHFQHCRLSLHQVVWLLGPLFVCLLTHWPRAKLIIINITSQTL